MKIVKKFKDGSEIGFGKGRFDDYCVYLDKKPPLDVHYFTRLYELKEIYGGSNIYNDFIYIYELVTKKLESAVLENITHISQKYKDDIIRVDKIFTILYMAMIAEENKVNTKLGKKIKRLGVHQILIENITPNVSANYSKGMKWREIEKECIERGF
ncbi:hypothetical protein OAU49_02740 [Alphaproteobacteria bacterium]|nr:hypothetical protein [Alphaproteobacteria bacterium]